MELKSLVKTKLDLNKSFLYKYLLVDFKKNFFD